MTSPLCVATGGWCWRVFHYRPPTPMYRNSRHSVPSYCRFPRLCRLKMRKVQLGYKKVTLPHGEGNKRGDRDMAETQERIKTALYARVYNDDYESILAPLERLRTLAEENGLETVLSFYDINGGRQDFDLMMRYGTEMEPPFRKILVLNQSQFCPIGGGKGRMHEEAGGHGSRSCASMIISKQRRNTWIPGWQPSMSSRAKIGPRKSSGGLRHAASKGHFVSSTVPYGYRKVTSDETARQHFTLELDPGDIADRSENL